MGSSARRIRRGTYLQIIEFNEEDLIARAYVVTLLQFVKKILVLTCIFNNKKKFILKIEGYENKYRYIPITVSNSNRKIRYKSFLFSGSKSNTCMPPYTARGAGHRARVWGVRVSPVLVWAMTSSVTRVRPKEAKRDDSSTFHSRTNSRTAKPVLSQILLMREKERSKRRDWRAGEGEGRAEEFIGRYKKKGVELVQL